MGIKDKKKQMMMMATKQKYSYHFQCWNCLTLHEGMIESDNQLLELECKELIRWNNDVNAPDLFNLLGKPRVCGKTNHVYGRKTKTKRSGK